MVEANAGGFRRRIIIVVGKHETRATLEDDFHHFRVSLRHDTVVRSIEAETLRYPWTSCARAADELRLLEGMVLSPEPLANHAHADAAGQCTHMFDLAGLAIVATAQGAQERHFLVTVSDPDKAGSIDSTVARDGDVMLGWRLSENVITDPDAYRGQPVGRGFAAWVVRERPTDEAEAALVMRRAVQTAYGRSVNLERLERPLRSLPCYSLSPIRMNEARPMRGTRRRFDGPEPEAFADEDSWLHDKA